jgi:hypothetical protein
MSLPCCTTDFECSNHIACDNSRNVKQTSQYTDPSIEPLPADWPILYRTTPDSRACNVTSHRTRCFCVAQDADWTTHLAGLRNKMLASRNKQYHQTTRL